MKRPSEITVDPKDPWKDDDLQRRAVGEVLASFIHTLRGPFVIALESPWGSGKSTFLSRLAYHLANSPKPIPTIRVDAWRSDYLQDPLLAYVAAINARLDAHSGRGRRTLNDLIKGIARQGVQLCSVLVPVAARMVLPGADTALKEISEAISKVGGDLLAIQKQHEETQAAFGKLLGKARDILTGGSPENPSTMVIIVDELDRCRPEFAVSALERIKHFFDTPGIIFLLATDGVNLPAAVRHIYGGNVSAEKYLRKFIDFEFHLPPPEIENYVYYLVKELQLEALISKGQTLTSLKQARRILSHDYLNARNRGFDLVDIVTIFPAVASAHELQLRDQLQAFTIVACALRSAPVSFQLVPHILCFCACLRFSAHEEYIALKQRRTSLMKLISAASAPLKGLFATPIGIAIQSAVGALDQKDRNSRNHIMKSAQDTQMQRGQSEAMLELQRCATCVVNVAESDGNKYVYDLISLVELFAPAAEVS